MTKLACLLFFVTLSTSSLPDVSHGQQLLPVSRLSCPVYIYSHRKSVNTNITCTIQIVNGAYPRMVRWSSPAYPGDGDSAFSLEPGAMSENRVFFPFLKILNKTTLEATLMLHTINSPDDFHRRYTLSVTIPKYGRDRADVSLRERGRGRINFEWWDYFIFAIILLVSAGIGIYHGFFGRKLDNQTEYMLGGRNMSWVPVSLSLLASFMSAITLLGTPSEVARFGTQYLVIAISYPFVAAMSAHIFIPTFYKLRLTSAYEYLEMRFSKPVRVVGAVIFVVQMTLYMAMVVFAPSIALQAVIGLNFWFSALTTATVCIFYTAMGGMRATMWTDAFQVAMMYIGLMAIFIQGCLREGGFPRAWEIAMERGRVEFFEVSPDPRIRHSFWSVTIGSIFTWLYTYGVNQAQVQRGLSCRSLKDMKLAYWLNVPGLILMMLIPALCGILLFARYVDCDPLQAKLITKRDQLLIFYVVDIVAEDLPGIPGLFMASLFAAALSTLSSGINGLAAVTCRDFGVERWLTRKGWTELRITWLAKVISALYGGLCILLMLPIQYLPGLLDSALGLFGALGGPLLGTFACGILVPWINGIGALAGLLSSIAVTLWLTFGEKTSPNVGTCQKHLSISTMACDYQVVPSDVKAEFIQEKPLTFQNLNGIENFYSVSYLYLSIIGIFMSFSVGIIVSAITGFRRLSSFQGEDVKLLHPMVFRIDGWVSGRNRKRSQPTDREKDIEEEINNEKIEEQADERSVGESRF